MDTGSGSGLGEISGAPVQPASAATIVACSTPSGPAQRAVLRASGPDCESLLLATLRLAQGEDENARALDAFLGRRGFARGRIDDGIGLQPALVLWMPAPASYTREDVFEWHLPGSPPLVQAALARLLSLGARRAERGEFTRRAFLNGRLDLTRAEGVLELVAASTEREARAAQELLGGGLERRVEALRSGLEELRALAEASLDFDESDTGHVPGDELRGALGGVLSGLEQALGWESRRQAPSALPRVVLVGAPNAGKSTLFNALVPGVGALVSGVAGTTRDWLEGEWDLGGRSVLLIDTAGLNTLKTPGESTSSPDSGSLALERRAQARGLRLARGADLLLWVLPADLDPRRAPGLPDECRTLPRVLVRTKADLVSAAGGGDDGGGGDPQVWVAAREGAGLEDLTRGVAAALGLESSAAVGIGGAQSGGTAMGTGLGAELFARHRAALEAARSAARRAEGALAEGAPLDWVAEILREACDALDSITGRTTPEDLLDRIFARFCLGK